MCFYVSHTFDDNEESNCCFCCVQENTFSVLMIKVVVSCVNEIWMTAGFKSIRLVDILLSTEHTTHSAFSGSHGPNGNTPQAHAASWL